MWKINTVDLAHQYNKGWLNKFQFEKFLCLDNLRANNWICIFICFIYGTKVFICCWYRICPLPFCPIFQCPHYEYFKFAVTNDVLYNLFLFNDGSYLTGHFKVIKSHFAIFDLTKNAWAQFATSAHFCNIFIMLMY